ncbi:GNAT family N-acetyltransferase [Novilysobacter antarcticus]|uniref:GNAT family N-acetyltransferase n=1 Tax=Novilysobacter antarcticus TaxID=2862543 RepID=UPI001C9933EC|nr:GNAT family N-acetyltransferase [Lysobacter antarcticus]
MNVRFRPALGAQDCHFIHQLIMSEVSTGHFDAGLLDPRASAGLMQNIQKMAATNTRLDSKGNEVPASIVMVDADGDKAGFGITTVLDLHDVKINEFWLAGIAPNQRRKGVMTALTKFLCDQLDERGIRIGARLLPASDGMRAVLINSGFLHVETLPSGHAFLIRKARPPS